MLGILKKALPATLFRFIWYISIFSFLVFLPQISATSPAFIVIFLLSIPIGIVSYLIYLVNSKRRFVPIIELVFALFLVVVGPSLIFNFKGNKITHDGTRTGPRVSYSSYCNPKGGYVILENEKLPFTTDEGLQVLWTKNDIECYKNKIVSASTPTIIQPKKVQNFVKESQIECWGPDGNTFMTTQKECNTFRAAWGYGSQQVSAKTTTSSYDCYFEGKLYKASTYEECKRGIAEVMEVRRLTAELKANSGSYGNYSYPAWYNDTSEGEQIMKDIQNIDTTIEPWIPPILPTSVPTPTCYPVMINGSQGVVCP